jgi:hypothetical protein
MPSARPLTRGTAGSSAVGRSKTFTRSLSLRNSRSASISAEKTAWDGRSRRRTLCVHPL